MAVIGGVTCNDMTGSGKVSSRPGGETGTRVLICDWADRFTLMDALTGGSTRGPGGIEVGFDDRSTFPGRDTLAAVAIEMEPRGGPSGEDGDGGPVYEKAILTVTYEPLLYTPGSNEEDRILATEVREHAIEVMMMPAGAWEWGAGASNAGHDVAAETPIYVPVTTRIFTRSDLEEIPDEIHLYVGYLNDAEYLGSAEETLLYSGATVERRIGKDGESRYQVRYAFKEKVETWNTFWHTTDGALEGYFI